MYKFYRPSFVLKFYLGFWVKDHVYWRINFHPEDICDIQEITKISEKYQVAVADLRKSLIEILARIKQSVPFYSPRYIGHMTSDSLIAGIIGYISTIFYNTNNISPLGSPITTPYEIEVGKDFARLMGYDPEKSWGHITSGGTVANLEVMWVARNLKYYPFAIKRVVEKLSYAKDFKINDKLINEYSPWELLCLPPKDVLSLRENLIAYSGKNIEKTKLEIAKEIDETILKFAPSKIGWPSFLKEFKEELIGINDGVVLVPKTKHYSWIKAMDIFGLGSEKNLIGIDIDENYRINTKKLKEKLEELENNKNPVIMIVAVLCSTEEGSIDPTHDIANICSKYYKHADAAYGGYFTTLLYKKREKLASEDDIDLGKLKSIKKLKDFEKLFQNLKVKSITAFSEYLFKTLSALKEFESATIDPHKLGYIPIPAGGIVFKDKRVRELISFTAPYAFGKEEKDVFIGQYILEGSKPGASAVACYLAHKVVSPTIEGYGYILARTIKAARKLYEKIVNIRIDGIKIIPISEPDTNVLCFAVNFDDNQSLSVLNKLNREIYKQLSIDDKRKPISTYKFLISKTEFGYKNYKSIATDALLKKLGITVDHYTQEPRDENQSDEILILRMCAMNPWSCDDKYVDGFIKELESVLRKFIHKILIIEDEENDRKRIQNVLINTTTGGLHRFRYDQQSAFRLVETGEEAIKIVKKEKFDVIVLDLMLIDRYKNAFDGHCILRELRTSEFKNTPVIVYTQKEINNNLIKELKDVGLNEDIDKCINKNKKDLSSEVKVLYEIIEKLL